MTTVQFYQVTGMTCAACANRIEKRLMKAEGVIQVQVNLTTNKARVAFDGTQINDQEIIDKIERLGFQASLNVEEPHTEKTVLLQRFILSAILTLPLLWAMAAHFSFTSFIWVPDLFLNPFFQLALALPIQLFIGQSFYIGAWNALRNRTANMDVLVVLSTSAAFLYSHYLTFATIGQPAEHLTLYYESCAVIFTFLLLGKYLEAMAKDRTKNAIRQLHQLQPKTANVLCNQEIREIPVEELVVGDIFIVKPGERIPTDGIVLEGHASIDQSIFTGESLPVEKWQGHAVIGATVNQSGWLKVQTTKVGSDTALTQVIKTVEEAQLSKAPIQRLADEITDVFVPILITIALITFAAWYYFFTAQAFGQSLEKAIAVLIIACPCALGLATPMSILVVSGRAAQLGILFKQGKYVETLQKVDTVIFDKTGTLTLGKHEVVDIEIRGWEKEAFLRLVAAAETTSEHPLAAAVVAFVKARGIRIPTASSFTSYPGYGIQATVEGQSILIGSPKFLGSKNVDTTLVMEKVEAHAAEGKMVTLVSINDHFAGYLVLSDIVKEDAKPSVQRLTQMGKETIMLTGDNPFTARSIARQAGIGRVYAGILPSQKAELIRDLQAKGKKVAMVGDGVNDAPALMAANIGIALGTGADISKDSADILIMHGDVKGVVHAFSLSQKAMTNIKRNLFWALFYNVIAIPATMLGFLEPWLAGVAMAFSSVSVVLNALRLRNSKIG
ncbi:heavy metal translocating P-type ATPase [Brevibacillus reuszeri]|uniref:heavy metal translocating P-type ATPase n=1 Tax=Brevibacillus reuszeri TaxID=54915 RepID=UPI00289E4938|nr:heavy metal translocating P-type ATPase [Brevibacillus reuszeri]